VSYSGHGVLAVDDFAARFRAALNPPAQAGVTMVRAELAAHFDEPLPEHGKFLGREGMVELVTRCCELAQELARAVEASPRLEATAPAPTNTVCFRYRPEGWLDGEALDDLNRRIQAHVVSAGEVFFTGAELTNGACQRVAIVSWRTSSDDVQALVGAIEAAGARLSSSS
jgi:glutamate/tyrosine decarboxylase-like PLP-dependent enzyme